jgi:hypothetical protein
MKPCGPVRLGAVRQEALVCRMAILFGTLNYFLLVAAYPRWRSLQAT